MPIYIQKVKVLKNIHTLNELNNKIELVLSKQKELLNQELNLRIELHKLKTDLHSLEKQIAQEVADANRLNIP
jgi:hypothetical protein